MYRHLILSALALSLVIVVTPVTALSQLASENQWTQSGVSSGVQLAHHGDHHGGRGDRHGGCGW